MVRRLNKLRAFTLVELLVVMAIVGALAVAVVPAMRGISGSVNLTSAAGQIRDSLVLARQTAIARNAPVEVRIYSIAEAAGGTSEFRLLAAVRPDPADPAGRPPLEWIDKMRTLPGGVVIDDAARNTQFSTLLVVNGASGEAPLERTELASGVPVMLRGKTYRVFTFRPDGTTDLSPSPANPWTLSLRQRRDQAGGASSQPGYNFITLVIDPVLGRVRTFQP